jgi:hypothetical protein
MRGLIICALLAGCGDNSAKQYNDAGIDAVPDAAPGRLTGCLDQPTLPTAPTGQLPCDLVPPGLQP